MLGLGEGRWQAFRSVAAMVAVITAVLAGSAIGLLAAVASEHSLVAALVAGGVVAVAALAAMMRFSSPRGNWPRPRRSASTQTTRRPAAVVGSTSAFT